LGNWVRERRTGGDGLVKKELMATIDLIHFRRLVAGWPEEHSLRQYELGGSDVTGHGRVKSDLGACTRRRGTGNARGDKVRGQSFCRTAETIILKAQVHHRCRIEQVSTIKH